MNSAFNQNRAESEPSPAELEQRIAILENPSNQGAAFDASTWRWLVFLGLVLPATFVFWAWW